MHHLDPDDPRPPYQQVSKTLGQEIVSGRYRPGDKLPTHRQVADDFGVSVGTIKRAFAVLQSRGLIVTRQGQGAFVRTQVAEKIDDSAEHEGEPGDQESGELWQALGEVSRRHVNIEVLGKEVRELRRHVELIGSHLVALYERVGQPYPYDSLNEVIEPPAGDVAKRGR